MVCTEMGVAPPLSPPKMGNLFSNSKKNFFPKIYAPPKVIVGVGVLGTPYCNPPYGLVGWPSPLMLGGLTQFKLTS